LNSESDRPIESTPIEPVRARVPWSWLVVAGPPVILATVPLPDLIEMVLAITWILLGIPIGILSVLDWYRKPNASGGRAHWARNAMRIPILLFGILSVLIGASVLAWVGYKVFWQRQPAFQWTGALHAQFGFIAFGLYLIRSALARQQSASVDDPAEELRRRTSA